jgi:hypothetical protein
MTMEQRLLVVSPVRNEAAHIEGVARALEAQSRRPDLWLVVDDQSTDETPQILARLAEQLDFMRVLSGSQATAEDASKDRLADARPPRAFNRGLRAADWRTFTHIAKLDGDTELPERYYELLLGEFARDPRLGLAGGVMLERDGTDWATREQAASRYHVRGPLKCYTRECLEAIGGIQERLAWDDLDEVYARMRGFQTRSLPQLVVRHHRQSASADGILRGRARHGQCAHIVHFTLPWVTMRAFKVARERPRLISGVAFLYGYLKAMLSRSPQVEDPEFRRFVRRELRERERAEVVRLVSRGPSRLASSYAGDS